MTFATVRHGQHLVVILDGDLDMVSAPGVLADLDQQLAQCVPGRVVVDLAGVDFLDSSGLAALAALVKEGRRLSFDVALTGVAPRHRRLLDIVRMSDMFLQE